ncbi:WD40 repeat domain-containing protein [Sphingobacterium paludis]|uniref:WD domain G-beta repeat uncharacterized protein n=1 Tax=Sphingobacterium paludis TaxID=1476465 RepID=A0A4R7D3X6_9SPHI|nr:WD40 repeat domain-containing protein [Sphingobacterium paludis]TDS15763.1 WD domain G-beta repeat uncharacterized protein [Sphingobacterium paludis]
MYTLDISLKTTLPGHQNPIFALAAGLDGSSIFSAGNDKGVVEWDLKTGTFKRIVSAVPASVYCLHLIPELSMLLVGMRNGELWCVDVAKQQLVKKLTVERGAVFAVQTLAEKREIVAIGEEGVAYVWSMDSFDLLYRFRVSSTTVRTIQPYPSAKQLVFGDKDGYIYLYDLADFKEIEKRKVHTMPVTALAVTDLHLYSGGRDAKLYQLQKKDLSEVRELTPHLFTVYSILPHPHLPVIATVSRDKSIKIWDSATLALLKNISLDRGYDSHRLSINTAIWHGDQLVTAGDDKLIKIWDVSLVSR